MVFYFNDSLIFDLVPSIVHKFLTKGRTLSEMVI